MKAKENLYKPNLAKKNSNLPILSSGKKGNGMQNKTIVNKISCQTLLAFNFSSHFNRYKYFYAT